MPTDEFIQDEEARLLRAYGKKTIDEVLEHQKEKLGAKMKG